jgi:mannose/cellobiose epimerase-like protein (N-acyl-D-glucosamine 2-epimerase family)
VNDARLRETVTKFHARFVGGTLPFLVEHGWDHARGGLIERLTWEGSDDGTPYRRVMVHARQLYVFSTWAAETGDAALADHADRIFAYMTERFWDHQDGGWIEKVDLEGSAHGFDKDLYAHAFALFGLGSYSASLGRSEAKVWMDRTCEVLKDRFHRPDGSYADRMMRSFGDLIPDRRSQNPHMHLLEATLFLTENGHHQPYAEMARSLIGLFHRAFHDTDKGVVLEYLDRDFAPHGKDGHRIEPGHHFEWSWLLDWACRTFGEPGFRVSGEAILERGLAMGWDPAHGGVFDEVDRGDGRVILSTKRIWPLLELIKALGVYPGAAAKVSVMGALDLLLERYLNEDGRWIERYKADWSPADQTMPSSTAYHISMALSELERATSER